MGQKVRSARGEIIDLDLLKIKEQIAAAPATISVQQRQDFIERKIRRRRGKRLETTSEIDIVPEFASKDQDSEDLEDVIPVTESENVLESSIEPTQKTQTTKQRARKAK